MSKRKRVPWITERTEEARARLSRLYKDRDRVFPRGAAARRVAAEIKRAEIELGLWIGRNMEPQP